MERRPTSDAYRAALDGTVALLQRRARLFRDQVVAVVVVLLAGVAASLLMRTTRPLGIVLALVPICGGYLLADARLVERWHSALLERWRRGELDLTGFREAVHGNRRLPPATIGAMLAMLPSTGDLATERRIAPATRGAVAATFVAVRQRRSDSMLVNVLAASLVVIALLAALWLWRPAPLLAAALVVVRPPAGAWLRHRRAAAARAAVETYRANPGFSEADYARLLESVN